MTGGIFLIVYNVLVLKDSIVSCFDILADSSSQILCAHFHK